jgi:chloramphenicol-sensitive protein RarD
VNRDLRVGMAAGVAAYGLWGSFPLYFRLLEPTGALEILAHRILWSLVVVGLLLLARGGHGWVRAVRADRRMMLDVGAAALLIAVNWLVYVWAVNDGRVVDAALGYFVNPLVTVTLGVVVLGERLRRPQWFAVALGGVSVVVIAIGYGRFPWISIVLALSFAGYGFLKRRIPLRPLESLAAETTLLVPVAAAILITVAAAPGGSAGMLGDGIRFGAAGVGASLVLMTTGAVTATPLALFATAARRIPLSMLGLLQYLTPAAQFLIGVLVFGEDMPPERLAGFLLVWAALAMLSFDALRMLRPTRIPPSATGGEEFGQRHNFLDGAPSTADTVGAREKIGRGGGGRQG